VENGTAKRRLGSRFETLALSQKINLIFALFFSVSLIRWFVDIRTGPAAFQLTSLVFILLFLVLALFDNKFIRYLQVGGLVTLGLLLVYTNADPSDLSAFVLFSIGLSAAYKMSLFGRYSLRVIAIIVVVIVAFAVASGTMHGFSFMQRVNIVNFILVYMALLYVIFEEETLSLRKQRDTLSRQADELRPFATLGNNTAGLVHDFKGDVAGLYAIASIERMSDNSEAADRIQSYAERLNERVEAILDVATAGNRYEPEELDLTVVLRHVIYYFVEVNRDLKHKVRITSDLQPGVTLTTRRNALMVILENVIKNAIEATEGVPERSVSIRSFREPRDNDDNDDNTEATITIEISHNGRRLPQHLKSSGPIDVRRSEYFRRGQSTKPGGTGLGMINVIRALEVTSAEMTMRNLESGVECRITLPAEDASPSFPKPEPELDSDSDYDRDSNRAAAPSS
jgi:signal transduction histidine kinase